jgi:hypothetical protein
MRMALAVSCLLYQCSEGNVPETELFRYLDALHDKLAHRIAHDLASARKVPWNFPDRADAPQLMRIV